MYRLKARFELTAYHNPVGEQRHRHNFVIVAEAKCFDPETCLPTLSLNLDNAQHQWRSLVVQGLMSAYPHPGNIFDFGQHAALEIIVSIVNAIPFDHQQALRIIPTTIEIWEDNEVCTRHKPL